MLTALVSLASAASDAASLSLALEANADAEGLSLAFLEANADAEGVRVLPSGLQYRVLVHGPGTVSPATDTPVEMHWEGYTATTFNATPTGAPFYSTYAGDGPMPLTPQEGTSAWEEALQFMCEGDKWEVAVPSQLGYGDEGMEGIVAPGEALVYVLELVRIEGSNAVPRRNPEEELHAAEEALQRWEDLDGGTGLTRLHDTAEATTADPMARRALKAWAAAQGPGRPLVLALLRRPLAGVLLAAFLESAAAHAGERAAYAYSAESYFVESPLERHLGLTAPAVFVSTDGGETWARCAAGLDTPAWSHAPLTLLEPRMDAEGKPAPPSVAVVREALELCVFDGAEPSGTAQLHGEEL